MNNSALSAGATTADSLPIFLSLICLHLSLSPPSFLPLSLSLSPLPLIVAVSLKRCCCQGNIWADAADVCNPGNHSLTCSSINPASVFCHLRHKRIVILHIPFHLYITYCIAFLLSFFFSPCCHIYVFMCFIFMCG